jgi:hypothetical protein
MDRIDALRNIDGRAAVFLRYGKAGYLVIGVDGAERMIARSDWLALPLWTAVPPKHIPDARNIDAAQRLGD